MAVSSRKHRIWHWDWENLDLPEKALVLFFFQFLKMWELVPIKTPASHNTHDSSYKSTEKNVSTISLSVEIKSDFGKL